MLIVTESGLFRMDDADESGPHLLLEDGIVECVAQSADACACAFADGDVAMFGQEQKRISSGIPESIESLLITKTYPLTILLGTEPPRLYRLCGDDDKARLIPEFDALPCRDQWHTPWGGPPAVRSLAGRSAATLYADIHVGSIMRSADGGESWEAVTPTLNEDVHQVATCRILPRRVCANTARGVYVSDDRGGTWHHRAEDLGNRYGRAIAIHPEMPDCFIASVSDGPHGDDVHGQLHVTHDAGHSWKHISDGFPASTTANINTFQLAFTEDGTAWGAVERILYRGDDKATKWAPFWEATHPIRALSQLA